MLLQPGAHPTVQTLAWAGQRTACPTGPRTELLAREDSQRQPGPRLARGGEGRLGTWTTALALLRTPGSWRGEGKESPQPP